MGNLCIRKKYILKTMTMNIMIITQFIYDLSMNLSMIKYNI